MLPHCHGIEVKPLKYSVNQGQSKITPMKESTFDYAASISAGVWRSFVNNNLTMVHSKRLTYHVLDMNAGSGRNDSAQCDGSPIVMLKRFRGLPVKFYFCDINSAAMNRLREMVGDSFPEQIEDCEFWNMDNAEAPARFIKALSQRESNLQMAMGHILSDPNGNVNGANYAKIAEALRFIPKIDLFVNFNHGSYLRTNGCSVCKGDVYRWNLNDVCQMMGKRHWLVRSPLIKGGTKFLIAVGRNFETSAAEKSGWFDLRSVVGQQIATDAPKMLANQGYLFQDVEAFDE
jgi:hypothetical protein